MRAPLRLARPASAATALTATMFAPVTSAAPVASANPSGKSVELTLAGTHDTGVYDESASEIPAFDATTGRHPRADRPLLLGRGRPACGPARVANAPAAANSTPDCHLHAGKNR